VNWSTPKLTPPATFRPPPSGEFSDGIATLLFRLRQELLRDDLTFAAGGGFAASPDDASEIAGLQTGRDLLLTVLDDLVELAVWSSRPVSSWSDIESRFCRFALSFSTQLDRESKFLGISSGRQTPVRPKIRNDVGSWSTNLTR
jgi:hypothetical protein